MMFFCEFSKSSNVIITYFPTSLDLFSLKNAAALSWFLSGTLTTYLGRRSLLLDFNNYITYVMYFPSFNLLNKDLQYSEFPVRASASSPSVYSYDLPHHNFL